MHKYYKCIFSYVKWHVASPWEIYVSFTNSAFALCQLGDSSGKNVLQQDLVIKRFCYYIFRLGGIFIDLWVIHLEYLPY